MLRSLAEWKRKPITGGNLLRVGYSSVSVVSLWGTIKSLSLCNSLPRMTPGSHPNRAQFSGTSMRTMEATTSTEWKFVSRGSIIVSSSLVIYLFPYSRSVVILNFQIQKSDTIFLLISKHQARGRKSLRVDGDKLSASRSYGFALVKVIPLYTL
jgi:hypothetical protein